MGLTWIDAVAFIGFIVLLVTISMLAGRKRKDSEDYFLAGRKLTWPLIGFSLIAANISTEHFVGMAGKGFGTAGLAIASYEWIAAVTLVIVAWWLLPKFLKAGIYTMPEFLEYRYDSGTRSLMAAYIMVAYIVVLLATVLYSGAQGLNAVFDIQSKFQAWFDLGPQAAEQWAVISAIWAIGIIGGIYTVYGGLKAVVWADLIQGGGLMLGAFVTFFLALRLIGGEVGPDGEMIAGSAIEGWNRFTEQTSDRLHVILPAAHKELPWTAIVFGGILIPNFFYWGLNQFITQRTLAAKSLKEGQKGIIFAAFLKLAIPFIIVMPGIMAFQLYGDELISDAQAAYMEKHKIATGGQVLPTTTAAVEQQIENGEISDEVLEKAGEKAYATLINKIVPPWLRGFLFAALCGAVVSTFNSGLNSSSTIFTIDIYRKYINPGAEPRKEVIVGRVTTAIIVVVACLWAPVILWFPEGVFSYIQEVWGFISPGIVAAFIVGLILKKAPPFAAKGAMVLGLPLYAFFRYGEYLWGIPKEGVKPTGLHGWVASFNDWAFLNHMALMLAILALFMIVVTTISPLRVRKEMPVSEIDVTVHPQTYILGSIVIAITIYLYWIFW
jgi:SSS family solute:Na+ symporter